MKPAVVFELRDRKLVYKETIQPSGAAPAASPAAAPPTAATSSPGTNATAPANTNANTTATPK